MLACLHAAVAEVERVLGLDELRAGCGSLNLVEEDTGDIIDVIPASIALVSDNGICVRGETYQVAFLGDEPAAASRPHQGLLGRGPTASSNASSTPSSTSTHR